MRDRNSARRRQSDELTEIQTSELSSHAQDWLHDCQRRQHSAATLENRRLILEKLDWFLKLRGHQVCGTRELRAFEAYLTSGHTEGPGRWGNTRFKAAVKPVTVGTYHNHLRAFFNFLVEESELDASPMEHMKPPKVADDQVQPFTNAEAKAILEASRRSRNGIRDYAISKLLIDTGCRASELCGLRINDVDLKGYKCTVLGKGNKKRGLPVGRTTTKALYSYLRTRGEFAGDDWFFVGERGGTRQGEALTRSGLLQAVERWGRAARIDAAQCSPHVFRHTFAVSFLRNGGNVFALKELLGHTSLRMVNRYVQLAEADLENQHRMYSPADWLDRQR